MDNLGKCHGKINIMIGLKANGSSSNWLPLIHCRTCDTHMSISNKPHQKETKANRGSAEKTSTTSSFHTTAMGMTELLQLPDKQAGWGFGLGVFRAFWEESYQHLPEAYQPVSKC